MSEPNNVLRRPSTGPGTQSQSIRGTGSTSSQQGLFFEVRVGERWSPKAKTLLNDKLGLASTVQGSTYNRIAKAKVLVFTGHHWVLHGGNPGEFRPMNRRREKIKTRGIDVSKVMRTGIGGMRLELLSYNAKLIIVSGCYTLHKKSAKWFHETFSNAAALGFFGSSPGKKGNFYEKFIERLPNSLDVDSQDDIEIIIGVWKKHIEEANSNRNLWKGGSSDPTTRKPGYMTAGGKVYIWKKRSQQWNEVYYFTI